MSNSAHWRKFQDSAYLWNWHWCHRLHCEDPALHIPLPAGETRKTHSCLTKTCYQCLSMLLLDTSTLSKDELSESVCIFANVGYLFHSLRHGVSVYGALSLYLSPSLQSKFATFAMYCTGLPGCGSHHKQLLPQRWYIPILPWPDRHKSSPLTRISQPSGYSGFFPRSKKMQTGR